MIVLEDRLAFVQMIDTAVSKGARVGAACATAGLHRRTYERWRQDGEKPSADKRLGAQKAKPDWALDEAEKQRILAVVNEERFADMPPSRIVPQLADEGRYLASESTMYRVLKQADQCRHRGRAKQPQRVKPPMTHVAERPNQVWCWDVTYLPAPVQGQWFYLYLILDLFSRKVVGWEVHARDDSEHAARLMQRTMLAEKLPPKSQDLVLHGDNGATLKATTVLAMLHWLGVKPSYSRPRVSNDNAHIESLFRHAKYRPEFPQSGFSDLDQARLWAQEFVTWYNEHHRHSGIAYVTPNQRHTGGDRAILQARKVVYEQAQARHPQRFRNGIRKLEAVGPVTLNPLKPAEVQQHLMPDNSLLRAA